jgi:DNA helicase-2/ATP-dependent DNA helicase PcrA
MDNLNKEQRYAATFNGKHLLVLAGAGTGKTRTIIARAKFLIESGVSPKRILILSFTRKSANEIVERISSELPETKSEGLSGQTFHSWCMALIKNNPNVFIQSSYTLLDEDDQESCIKMLCGKNWKYKGFNDKTIRPENVLSIYSYMTNARCSLSDAIRMKMYDNAPKDLNVEKDNHVIRDVITMYINYKQQRKYIDYDDILLIISKYLKNDEALRKHVTSLYDHILIDEMQDTNPLQYELLPSFYEDCHLFCVGDDAQSIYGFRGADFKTIHSFAKVVKNAKVCKLKVNYRSTQEILDISNWVIGNSPLKYKKKLKAHRGHGAKPIFRQWADEWEEARDIGKCIKHSFETLGKKWEENLVLSRSMFGLRHVQAILLKYKIPFVLYGGGSLMASRHVRDIVAPMRIVSNYMDEIAWSRYLQLWDNIGPINAADAIDRVINTPNLADSIEMLSNFVKEKRFQKEIVDTLQTISNKQYNPPEAISIVLKIMSKQLESRYSSDNSWNWRKEDFPILQELAKNTGSISEFVAEYVLDPTLCTTTKVGSKKEDGVILSTIHSAKGLEADNVYIVNASTFSYPTQRAILRGIDDIEEERRCLYVALTRARDYLYVYRDIHSIHTNTQKDAEYYFFNNLPSKLYQTEAIAANYLQQIKIEDDKISDINIYSDINLD